MASSYLWGNFFRRNAKGFWYIFISSFQAPYTGCILHPVSLLCWWINKHLARDFSNIGKFQFWKKPYLKCSWLTEDISNHLSSCILLTPLLCHPQWALLGEWVLFNLIIAMYAGQMREKSEGLMLWKTRSREWAEGSPSWTHWREVLRDPEWLILDHTTLTTSKEESETDAPYSFLPCLWSSVSKSLLYLS